MVDTSAKYELVIRIPIKAEDDVGARLEARSKLTTFSQEPAVVKLQCIYPDKQPKGIPL